MSYYEYYFKKKLIPFTEESDRSGRVERPPNVKSVLSELDIS